MDYILRLFSLDADYVDKRRTDTPRGFPGTRPKVPPANEVSMAVFEAKKINGGNKNKLSTLFMTVGQFLDHDFALSDHGKCDVSKYVTLATNINY